MGGVNGMMKHKNPSQEHHGDAAVPAHHGHGHTPAPAHGPHEKKDGTGAGGDALLENTGTPEAPAAAVPPAGSAEAAGLAALQQECEALKDRLLRLQADFDNNRKRAARERQEILTRANEDMMMELLPVLDHMDLALAAVQSDETLRPHAAVLDGFKVVADQLVAALKKFGLSPFDAQGQPFDVNRHEVIAQMESADMPEGQVAAQTRRGYMLGDRLLRPAQVVVSKGTSPEETAGAHAETPPTAEG